ncbi:MAG TPA: metallophosphoesterase, partial [Planctomycetota bacterium]
MNWRRAGFLLILLAGACGGAGANTPPQIGTIRQPLATRRLIIYGDSRPAMTGESFFLGRTNPVKERRLVIEQIARERPDLIIHSGDLVPRGSSEGYWKEWDEAHRPLFDQKIPFFPALGNHEYKGTNTEALRHFNQRFPALGGCRWYSLRSGPLFFVILDSNFDDLGHRAVNRQDDWYRKTLQDAEADREVRAVIVVCHHPP